MKLKTVEVNGKTYAEISDGKPIYIAEDGRETPFDAAHTISTISRLNGEAKGHREAKEAAEAKLKAFEGIEDGEAARKALETVKNLDQGQLMTAGKVDEIRAAAKKAAEEQIAAVQKSNLEKIKALSAERDGFERQLYDEKVGGAFARSKFIADKLVVPSDMVKAMFASRFAIEGGKIVGKGADGQPIYSRINHGNPAEFDEALELMIDGYPHRDSILKGTGASGSGARPGLGSNGAKTMSRAAFDQLDAGGRMQTIRDGIQIVDA